MSSLDPAQLQRIEDKLDLLTTSSATIFERVGNLRDQMQAHVLADALAHKEVDARVDEVESKAGKRLNSLEHTRTSWKASMASIAAGVAFVVSLILIGAREAIALMTRGG